MEPKELQEESTKNLMEEVNEEQFLKHLYLFMKKRDTPIERIPNLGFKQIDLFLMFKTVNDLGGYHQVTSHQLWKRVYNTLGGNPRSTSAATCTRRHYEKLLLPYECHLKGILMSTIPHHQPRPYRYGKDDDGGQRPSKRRLPLPPGSHCFQSDPHGNIYSLPLQYHPFYHPAPPVLPPYVPIQSPVMTLLAPPPPKVPRLPFQMNQDPVRGPLQQLRLLAEQYKTSAGLSSSEPLNLSKKTPTRESDTNLVSSFSAPSSSKNPKFLNKPSTLYTSHPTGGMRSDGNETQDGESDEGVPSLPESENKNDTHEADVQHPMPSDSPIFISALTPESDKDVFETPEPNSLKADFPVQPAEDRETRTDVEGFDFSHVLHRIPKDREGKMEIEVPLSVVRNWLKSAKMAEANKLLISDCEESLGKTNLSNVDIIPTDLTLRSPQHQSSAEDLRLKNKSSFIPNTESDNHRDSNFTSCKTSDGLLQNQGAGQNIWQLNQQEVNKLYKVKSTDFWNPYSKETMAPCSPLKPASSPPRMQGFASKFYMEDMVQRRMERLEVEPSAVLMVNSSPASVFPLSTDEIKKLQNIISSSS